MHLLGIISIIYVIYRLIKEAFEKPIPAENWENKDLIHKDRMSGLSEKEILKNVEQGRYIIRIPYPEQHRNPDNPSQYMIENCGLFDEDSAKYGTVQAMKWSKQGKYNLNASELEIENLRIKRKFLYMSTLYNSHNNESEKKQLEEMDRELAAKNWDFRHTEAVLQWQKARDADKSV